MENLRELTHAPSVQFKDIPNFTLIKDDSMDVNEDLEDPDIRISVTKSDEYIEPDNEFSDSEDEGDGRRDVTSHLPKKQKVTETDSSLVLTTNGINILSNKESI